MVSHCSTRTMPKCIYYLLFNIRDISNINALAKIHIPEKLIKSTHAQCVAHARNMIVPLHSLGLFVD